MPHNLYLHSALVQTRKIGPGAEHIRKALKINFLDSAVALNLAFLVNAAILILAATVFFKTGNTGCRLHQRRLPAAAHAGHQPGAQIICHRPDRLGPELYITGTLAGQIVMEGYLQLRINPWYDGC
jgi:manganese transport protein